MIRSAPRPFTAGIAAVVAAFSLAAQPGEDFPTDAELDASSRIEAEFCSSHHAVTHGSDADATAYMENFTEGSWIGFQKVLFASGAREFAVRLRASEAEGEVEVRLGMPDGPTVGTLAVDSRQGDGWQILEGRMQRITGVQPIYITFVGTGSVAVDWIRFGDPEQIEDPAPS